LPDAAPTDAATVGDLVAAFLEAAGVSTAFGVISIHNMPILDAFARRNRLRFVPARGEAGAVNMADAFARVSGGLGVGITSTGVAAGNAAGSLVEALTAGAPVLHITGQVELPYLDRARSYIHEAPKQPDMLKAISKAYFRVWSPGEALGVLRRAAETALTPPAGPVSVEIPIDVQAAPVAWPAEIAPVSPPPGAADPADVAAVAAMLASARRPLIWLGGGARGAASEAAARRLAALGVGFVSSVNGRGILAETHPLNLGAFNAAPPVEAFYGTCDLVIAVGSRLRGNETLKFTLKLPAPLVQVDADPAMDGRAYPNARFVAAEANAFLTALAALAEKRRPRIDPGFAADLAAAKAAAVKALRDGLGPYDTIVQEVRARFPGGAFVRDVTISNSTWGNRYVDFADGRQGVHPLGGGIGQGLPMAIGAALARPEKKTLALIGDGGFALALGELATAAQERANVVILLMNDRGYGVIRNIQDAQYGGRKHYADLHTPDFAKLAAALGVWHRRVGATGDFPAAFAAALAHPGPAIVELDMVSIGPFARAFAGPPVRKA
jgi:acetolactate synthase I/II/III large subunit